MEFIEQFGPTTADTVINAASFGLTVINRPRTAKPPTDALKRSIARTFSVHIYCAKSWLSRDMVHIMFCYVILSNRVARDIKYYLLQYYYVA